MSLARDSRSVASRLTEAEATLRLTVEQIGHAAAEARRVAEAAEAEKPPTPDPVWREPLPPNPRGIAWLDALREQILSVDATLRPLIRATHYDRRPGRVLATRDGQVGPGITISADEARILLRAALPVPLSGAHKRGAHAELVAALSVFGGTLLDLNDPYAGPAGIAAACDLIEALRAWVGVMRWHQATARGGVTSRGFPAPERERAARARASPDPPGGLFDYVAARTGPEVVAEPPARARRRGRATARPVVAGQRELLLPLPGKRSARQAGAADQADARQQAIVADIIARRARGDRVRAISAETGVSESAIYRLLRVAAAPTDQAEGRAARAG